MPAGRSAHPRPRVSFSGLPDLLRHHAGRSPNAPALLAPGRDPLTYARLNEQAGKVGATLRAIGISPQDRVAVALPNGPEMAAAIVTVASSAGCAPINPAYGREELDRYFDGLRPAAVITQAGFDAAHVARSRRIRVLELSAGSTAEAGCFTLGDDEAPAGSCEVAGPGSVALLLLTSGTTARPKIVPLTHANICSSASSSGAALALAETDRCLNVLPLFHGHGLIATVIASLAAGASVVCTPGCDVERFFGWITDFRPTWYSAVPTMHQAILARARLEGGPASHRLRFVRSASAPLPPSVLLELERIFGTCVIEFYGMTETASAPIACNPMPPGRRKAGSVGVPVGLDVAIMDDQGARLPRLRAGQVHVRGASVTQGYDGDPQATLASFSGDWFNTGDQGFFDQDGYLFLTGRTREMINRGGEKVAPREVDEVLLEHPAVAEAVTFAVPHATLGEDVAAAVVLRPHATATAKDIRQFAIGRLADFKVPQQVFMVDALPKSSTGKVQRVGLAAKLGLASLPQAFAAPRTALEQGLARHWAEILTVEQVGIHDNFFALGGDSLLATRVLAHVHELTHCDIEVSQIFETPTVAEMAQHLQGLIEFGAARRSCSAIARVARDAELPASIAQERLWKLQRMLPGLPFFNVLYVLRVASPVNVAVLECSINELVRRHEILRTTFALRDGRLLQVVAPELAIPVSCDDLQELPESEYEAAGQRLVHAEALHSFDLMRGPLLRARLLRRAEREHLLILTTHQLIVDGWSLGVLVDELARLYDAWSTGRAPAPAPPSIHYADFASWQRQWQSRPEIVSQLAYWREQLRPPMAAGRLATLRPRSALDHFRTARRSVSIPADLLEAARRFAQHEGGTLFMVLIAALKTVLHSYLGENDLRVATNVANRNRPGADGIVGPIVNTVVLRTDLGGDPSFREVMRRVRATTLAAFAHQDLPFEELAETLARERGVTPADLAEIMLLLHNPTLRPAASSAGSLAFEEADPGALLPLVTATTFDVIVMLRESEETLVGTCVYKPRLFRAKTIDRLLRDFQEVLEKTVRQPERPISETRAVVKEKPQVHASLSR